MKNSNGAKYLIILALLVSVVALSIGFAALTTTLTIKSTATYSYTENIVALSTVTTGSTQGNVTPTLSPTSGGPTGDTATLTTTQITGIKANFTGTGQKVTYTFAARNIGHFTAYLKSVTFSQAGASCTPGTNTTASYVTAACADLTLTVKIGSGTPLSFTATNSSISGHSLATSAGEPIVVEIEYPTGSDLADGDFTADFGTITILYSTAS